MKNKISLGLGVGLLLCPLVISQQTFASTEQQVTQETTAVEKNLPKEGTLTRSFEIPLTKKMTVKDVYKVDLNNRSVKNLKKKAKKDPYLINSFLAHPDTVWVICHGGGIDFSYDMRTKFGIEKIDLADGKVIDRDNEPITVGAVKKLLMDLDNQIIDYSKVVPSDNTLVY